MTRLETAITWDLVYDATSKQLQSATLNINTALEV
jgi:hypothetical protein